MSTPTTCPGCAHLWAGHTGDSDSGCFALGANDGGYCDCTAVPPATALTRYWCRACAFEAMTAEQSNAHHDATGHNMTHRGPARASAPASAPDALSLMLETWERELTDPRAAALDDEHVSARVWRRRCAILIAAVRARLTAEVTP